MKIKNIKLLSFVLFYFFMMSCHGQKKEKSNYNNKTQINTSRINDGSQNKQYKVMKKLDKNKIEKYKKNAEFKYTENDSVFKLEDQGRTYREIKNKIGEHLKVVNIYDKDKLVLTGEGNFMFDCPVGIHRDYDSNGNIKKEKNFDKDFPFTFINLKQKLLKEFGINIENKALDLRIDRSSQPSEHKSKYEILLYNELRSHYRYIVIDGATGNTIKDLNVKALD